MPGWTRAQALITSALNNQGGQYGYTVIPSRKTSRNSPSGKITAQLANDVRDSLAAHLAGFKQTSADKPCGRCSVV